MHEVIERLKHDGTRIEDDWLRRIGPAHFAHINFRGAMRFGARSTLMRSYSARRVAHRDVTRAMSCADETRGYCFAAIPLS